MKEVYLVDGVRSPQVKSGTELKDIPVPYLAHYLVRHLLDKGNIPKEVVDEVIFGNTGAPAKYPNIGRVIALEAGLPESISGYTVHRNCASGMQALSEGYMRISSGRYDVVVAGGVESMSQMPLMFSRELTEMFINLMKAKSIKDKVKALSRIRPKDLAPVIAIEQGLTDPFCGLNMGNTAELLAREMGITREQQDSFALESHQKAIKAQEERRFDDELIPLAIGYNGAKLLDHDIGPRKNSSLEKLGKMKPYFDRKSGTVTIANSCPITDGASCLLMASEEAVNKYGLNPIAKMHDFHFHGLAPERMGMGPLMGMHGVFARTGRKLEEMDLIEINEAFAAQVLAVKMASKEKKWANKYGIDPMGEIAKEKLNVNGGAVAMGHPVGSTGSRLVVTLMHELKKRGGKFGVASMCIGGGQGGAILIENLV